LLVGAICVGLYLGLDHRLEPTLPIAVEMDRETALQRAADHAAEFRWGQPRGEYRQVAWFAANRYHTHFLELEAGREALIELVEAGDYVPYHWCVRNFRENEVRSGTICFTPAGDLHSLDESIPDSTPGASLSRAEAEPLARQAAASWGVDLEGMELTNVSQRERESGRIDHMFRFVRTDLDVAGAEFGLGIGVAGDRANRLTRILNTPESFEGRYERMRERNHAIAAPAGLWLRFGILAAAVLALLTIGRRSGVRWRAPLIGAAVLTLAEILKTLNALPLMARHYDTDTPWATFVGAEALYIVGALLLFLVWYGCVLLGADVLLRRVFPGHLDPWAVWRRRVAASREVRDQTALGMALAGVMLLHSLVFYAVAIHGLGWFCPTGIRESPDMLAKIVPALSPCSQAFVAGFWEEWVCRGLTLGLFALIGRRFGGARWWLAAGVVVQALIFGMAHANYPQQPPYARVIELFIPSLLLGYVALRRGLYPCILAHVGYDLVLMATPLFTADTGGLWLQRALVVGLGVSPLVVIGVARLRAGRWTELPDSARLGAWVREEPAPATSPETSGDAGPVPRWPALLSCVLIGAGLVALPFIGPLQLDVPALESRRAGAIELARAELISHDADPSTWTAVAEVRCAHPRDSHEFVLSTAGREALHRLLEVENSPLCTPHWRVVFTRFGHESSEKYRVSVWTRPGTTELRSRLTHVIPASWAGAELDEDAARRLAQDYLYDLLGDGADDAEEVAVRSIERDDRVDWKFEYIRHGDPLPMGDVRTRITVQGDETLKKSWVHIPESWQLQQEAWESYAVLFSGIAVLLFCLVFVSALIACGIQITGRRFAWRVFMVTICAAIGVQVLVLWNDWLAHVAGFDTDQSLNIQTWRTLLWEASSIAGTSLLLALPLAGTLTARRRSSAALPAWCAGSLLGLAWMVLSTLPSHIWPGPPPLIWSGFIHADSRLPELSVILESLSSMAVLAVILALPAQSVAVLARWRGKPGGWPNALAVLGYLGLGFGISSADVDGPADVLGGCLGALFLALVIWPVLKRRISVAPAVAGATVVPGLVWHAAAGPHLGARTGAVLALLVVVSVVALLTRWKGKRDVRN